MATVPGATDFDERAMTSFATDLDMVLAAHDGIIGPAAAVAVLMQLTIRTWITSAPRDPITGVVDLANATRMFDSMVKEVVKLGRSVN